MRVSTEVGAGAAKTVRGTELQGPKADRMTTVTSQAVVFVIP